MTLGLYSAWNIVREGSLEITVNGVVLSMTTGRVAHVGMSLAGVAGFGQSLASLLLTTGVGWTVAFSLATSKYTIARGGTPFTIAHSGSAASNRMFFVLGALPAGAGVTTLTSQFVPDYAMRPAMQCVSNWTGLASGDATERRESDSGGSYAVGPSIVPVSTQWEHTQEPKNAINDDDSGTRGTWQRWWTHAGRYQEPCVMTWAHFLASEQYWPVFTLAKPDFSERTHSLMQADWDALWRIRIEAKHVRMMTVL